MSNIVNDQILENIAEEVNAMSNISIVNEVLDRNEPYSNNPPASDSWDEFFSFVLKRFEEMSQ